MAAFAGLAQGIEARELLEELARRQERVESRPDFLVGTFPEQRAFLEDTSQFKIAHCSRGAAKSYTAGLGLYRAMDQFPGVSCFYVTKTHDMARNIMWATVMKAIAAEFRVDIDFNETLLEGRHPNGSTFRLTGIDGDKKQQDKLLGGKYKLVVLDEVAFFETDLTGIIYRTLMPAVGRIEGSIWLLSTSSDFPRGLFYEATRPEREMRIKGWSVHEWQWSDNPYVRDEMQATRDKLVAANPLIVETPHFRQHWLNEWVVDETKLVYRLNKARSLIPIDALPKLPRDGWSIVLGVDLGWEDETAFVLTAYHVNDQHLYVLCTFGASHMEFDGVAARILLFMGDKVWAPHKVVIDGANKQGVESMRARSTIPFEYADKRDKATFIELANSDLVQGKIKILDTPDNAPLVHEMQSLVWVTEDDKIKYPRQEHPALPNHRCDAFLYAWRMGFHFHWAPVEQKIPIGSRAWYEKQAEDMWEREREGLERRDAGDGGWPEVS